MGLVIDLVNEEAGGKQREFPLLVFAGTADTRRWNGGAPRRFSLRAIHIIRTRFRKRATNEATAAAEIRVPKTSVQYIECCNANERAISAFRQVFRASRSLCVILMLFLCNCGDRNGAEFRRLCRRRCSERDAANVVSDDLERVRPSGNCLLEPLAGRPPAEHMQPSLRRTQFIFSIFADISRFHLFLRIFFSHFTALAS